MGKRIHVVKKQPKYGNTEAFNWKQEEFKNLLDSLYCNVCGEEYSDNFECEKRNYERAIEILKRFKKDGKDAKLSDLPTFESDFSEPISDVIDFEQVQECLNDLWGSSDETIDKIIKVMEDFLEEADPDSSWISFSVW